jgi:hypothetical protein
MAIPDNSPGDDMNTAMTTPIHDQLTQEHAQADQRIRDFIASVQPLIDELRELEAALQT